MTEATISGEYVFEPEQEGKLKGQILGIEGVSFPGRLWFGGTKVKTDISHVRCVGDLTAAMSFPEMSGLIAINSLQIEFPLYPYEDEPIVMPPFPALRKLYKVWVRGGDEVDLSGLEGLTELGELVIDTPGNVDLRGLRNLRKLDLLSISVENSPAGITSLEGLEGITSAHIVGVSPANTLVFDVPQLLNYEGLKNLEYVEKRLFVGRSAEGLKGLENLRSVGDLDADIVSEADIDVLANLEEVRGDLVLNLAQGQPRCSVSRLLEHVTVSGTITVDGLAWEDIKSRCEE